MDSVRQAIVADALACTARQLARVNGGPQRLADGGRAVSHLLMNEGDRMGHELPTGCPPGNGSST
jgi:hypothetical protein